MQENNFEAYKEFNMLNRIGRMLQSILRWFNFLPKSTTPAWSERLLNTVYYTHPNYESLSIAYPSQLSNIIEPIVKKFMNNAKAVALLGSVVKKLGNISITFVSQDDLIKNILTSDPLPVTDHRAIDNCLIQAGACYVMGKNKIFINIANNHEGDLLYKMIFELSNANNDLIHSIKVDDFDGILNGDELYARAKLNAEFASLPPTLSIYNYGVDNCDYPIPYLYSVLKKFFSQATIKNLLSLISPYAPAFLLDAMGGNVVEYGDKETHIKYFGQQHLESYKRSFHLLPRNQNHQRIRSIAPVEPTLQPTPEVRGDVEGRVNQPQSNAGLIEPTEAKKIRKRLK